MAILRGRRSRRGASETGAAQQRVELFAGTIAGTPQADGREIAEIALFARDALPDRRSRTVDESLAVLDVPGHDRARHDSGPEG